MKSQITSDETLRQCWSGLIEILPEFTQKIESYYKVMDWKVSVDIGEDGFRIPTAKELEGIAYSLAWEAYKNKCGCSSAGIEVRFSQDRTGKWLGTVVFQPVVVRSY